LLAACITGVSQAAPQRSSGIALGPVVRVSHFGSAHVFQAFLAASPADPKRLMLCGSLENSGELWMHAYVLLSTDGGKRWRRTLLDDTTGWMSEEACVFGTGNRAYFTAGASDVYNGSPHHESGHTHVYHSEDGGATWSKMYSRPDGWIDWPWLTVVHSQSGGETVVFFGNHATDKLGHWMDARPAVQEWDNASGVLTAPVAIDGPNVNGTFSGGSVTLADGTALFAAPSRSLGTASWATSEGGMRVFAYDVATHNLTDRATLRTVMGGAFGFPASMAMAIRGKYKDRLYSAWTEFDARVSQLWIASSDDGGFNWSSRPVVEGIGSKKAGECGLRSLTFAQVAVDRNGAVGLQWLENSTDMVFAASLDGGRTFGGRTVLSEYGKSAGQTAQYIGWTVPWNEYTRAAQALNWLGKPFRQMWDAKHLGLSVRLGPSRTLQEGELVADAAGEFHAGWSQPQPDSKYVYMSRAISVDRTALITPLPKTTRGAKCRSNPDLQGVEETIPDPVVPATADEDVTASFAIVPTKSSYDAVTHHVTAAFNLLNNGDKPLAGRFYLRVLGLHSDFGTPKAQFDRLDLSERELAPKAQTAPMRLRFTITGFKPMHVLVGAAVAMYLRVYRIQE